MEIRPPTSLRASSSILIEQCEDESLVFDLDSGATTFLSTEAAFLLDFLTKSPSISEFDLCSASTPNLSDAGDLLQTLASLEKSRLVFRC